MNNMYIIPANAKKGKLLFNLFMPIDLVILLIGVFISFILLVALPGDTVGELVLKVLPVGITGILVFPFAYYHNGRVYLREIYLFFTRQSRYIWRGWCCKYYEKH